MNTKTFHGFLLSGSFKSDSSSALLTAASKPCESRQMRDRKFAGSVSPACKMTAHIEWIDFETYRDDDGCTIDGVSIPQRRVAVKQKGR
ncbi:hypothetical protein KUG47_08830 [Falsochrobactrum sp. TDYN1]|uniref:Uncharacterized protein n=1 Tax=Falsochrobactrum tianjinense TaxID=2706015 RepID=A0A949PLT2_9HYPH|nr:hypothetical protein [Falsochrobactrum sp. TDYN1]MBV2143602.1 hypothetical protein [Falsochrobactrum sp. TDYN1]